MKMKPEIVEQLESYLRDPYTKVGLAYRNRKKRQEEKRFPEILFISSYPPRECGIATYSHDLFHALKQKFKHNFQMSVCALEHGESAFKYPDEVRYVLDTSYSNGYLHLAEAINKSRNIEFVLVQHEFGFFQSKHSNDFLSLLSALQSPAVVVFHTVLPNPSPALLKTVKEISLACSGIIVMTHHAASLLETEYGILPGHVHVIQHGTHLVSEPDKGKLKEMYKLEGKLVLSTFGLLSSGKGIELTLRALPMIIERFPNVVFLVIGKTHPTVVLHEGEAYRDNLMAMVLELKLENHVRFVNEYLPLKQLLNYLQLSDVYLFTSKDPNQAVSGTFSYALSCGCPVVSTPIPHAREVLNGNSGMIIDFNNHLQLAEAVNKLLGDEALRKGFKTNAIQKTLPSAWENSALAHAKLIQSLSNRRADSNPESEANNTPKGFNLEHELPEIKMDHLRRMTTDFGMLQFSEISHPDPESGYTLDDNARALIATCMHYKHSKSEEDLKNIQIYLSYIGFCQQDNGSFLNYVNIIQKFSAQNYTCDLSDSNGRAIWALGYLISLHETFPQQIITQAACILNSSYQEIEKMTSPRAMAFSIKGLYYANLKENSVVRLWLMELLGNRLLQMFKHESDASWIWFESYLTYANSVLPEAMLLAGLATGEPHFKTAAKLSFDFLLSKIFLKEQIRVVSNQTWLHKGLPTALHGEQPLDVCYTILALNKFLEEYPDEIYKQQMFQSFNWFLGNNHLNQIIYNPCTGGCYDGLEEKQVNLNQGAESTVCYLMARLTLEKHVIGVT